LVVRGNIQAILEMNSLITLGDWIAIWHILGLALSALTRRTNILALPRNALTLRACIIYACKIYIKAWVASPTLIVNCCILTGKVNSRNVTILSILRKLKINLSLSANIIAS